MIDRWLQLTRQTLPDLAAMQRWPIHADHCFMRVCLDVALGAQWDTIVARPAIRHLSDVQLADAVAIAERIVGDPACLPRLNEMSLAMRRGRRSQ